MQYETDYGGIWERSFICNYRDWNHGNDLQMLDNYRYVLGGII